jgi:hypothetical protein
MSSNYKIYPSSNFSKIEINSTIRAGGRLGNMIMRNIIISYIAEKNNLIFNYGYLGEMERLGIKLFKEGTNFYENTLLITDDIIDNILFNEEIYNKFLHGKNILFYKENYHIDGIVYSWCQTNKISKYIGEFVSNNYNKNSIIESNPYRNNYNNNNNVFVHVRLGDIVNLGFSTKYEYYESALSKINFEKGFISSDNIEHETCQKLIKKFNLEIYNNDEVNTIQFGSTNKYIVLSNGTFSWIIGLFAFYSKIFYPKLKINWHGDIYSFPEWVEIDF